MTENVRDTDPRIPPPSPRQLDASLKGYIERENTSTTRSEQRSQHYR